MLIDVHFKIKLTLLSLKTTSQFQSQSKVVEGFYSGTKFQLNSWFIRHHSITIVYFTFGFILHLNSVFTKAILTPPTSAPVTELEVNTIRLKTRR